MLKVFLVFLSLFVLIITNLLDVAKAQDAAEKEKTCHRFFPSGNQRSFSPLIHLTGCEK